MTRVVLAIDQAAVSGWAVCSARASVCKVEMSGVAKTAFERRDAVDKALCLATKVKSDLEVVMEDHSGFGFSRGNMSVKSLLGMGSARGRWLEVLDLYAWVQPSYVAPSKWRQSVLGLGQRVKGAVAKKAAQDYVHAAIGRKVGPDEAEAICIALWGAREISGPRTRPSRGSKSR